MKKSRYSDCQILNILKQARSELAKWFKFYNWQRPHSTFDGKRPMEIYLDSPIPGGLAPQEWGAGQAA